MAYPSDIGESLVGARCEMEIEGKIMAQETKHDETKKSFKDTLNLPHTDFPIRANAAVEDPLMLERWAKENLYHTSFELNKGKLKYILHDGPPYANGPIHLGHAYNKILKDIVCKARRMMGYQVPVTPGWDCHGLPIEKKVVVEQPGLERGALIKACREYADKWINVQRNEFKALGVLMDWERPYETMSKGYEAATVRAFGKFVEHGFIERKNKTVPWCFVDQTVLATAEIEYKDRKDPSIYTAFDLKDEDVKCLFPDISKTVSLVIWTTTPWTLPLNQAVLAKPGATYVLLDINGRYCLVGAAVADKLCGILGIEKVILHQISSDKFKNLRVWHPFINKDVPIILDDSVGLDEGTAFVHCAPGCGPEDYEIGVKNKLDIYSPISSDGRYTDLIEPKELAGMPVVDGQGWVIKKLMEMQKLIHKCSITHSYPHCWRCHNGLIFRATAQWFFDLERKNIKQRVLDAIETLNFVPSQGRNFLKATVQNRWEWCLSRQRAWGTPIPALLCENCDSTFLNEQLIEKVAQGIESGGIEYWEQVSLKELGVQDLVCKSCEANGKVGHFKKNQDILDVWFDAGVSHYAVLYKNPELAFPADLYLEGKDQHRGWFQSSLIMSLVIEDEACTKTFMTHGYTVDEKGQKMSKSLGNVVAPQDLIKQLGTDGLRLWVSSIGHENDPVVSQILLQNVTEVNRKIRNTCRFLLSNLYDFDLSRDALTPDKLLPIDHYALTHLSEVNGRIIELYIAGDFTGVFHALAEYCSVELSSFYLDIVKDRLYVEKGESRRSAQTALWYILDTLTRLIAPILSFTAEQVSDHYQKSKVASIHLQPFVDLQKLKDFAYSKSTRLWPDLIRIETGQLVHLPYDLENEERERLFDHEWQTLKAIRPVLLKALEIEREKGLIKHSLEAQITAYIDLQKPAFSSLKTLFEYMKAHGQTPEAFFKEFLIVSQFTFAPSREGLHHTTDEGIAVAVTQAQGTKCPRCWQYDVTSDPDGLCNRCQRVLAIK